VNSKDWNTRAGHDCSVFVTFVSSITCSFIHTSRYAHGFLGIFLDVRCTSFDSGN